MKMLARTSCEQSPTWTFVYAPYFIFVLHQKRPLTPANSQTSGPFPAPLPAKLSNRCMHEGNESDNITKIPSRGCRRLVLPKGGSRRYPDDVTTFNGVDKSSASYPFRMNLRYEPWIPTPYPT